jgi:endoglucanase
MASGGNDIGDINNSPPQEAYVLYGGVIGGPDKYDKYYDLRDDWPQAEVSLESFAATSYSPNHRLPLTITPHS